jgi:hypothetical protein
MTRSSVFILPVVGFAIACGSARAHNHVTVDTVSGAAGDQILVRAGYLPAESSYTISGGRLLQFGEIKVYDVSEQLAAGGPLEGWFAGDELLLTSDFYFATGRLEGGNFMWELADVTPLAGGPGTFVWGEFHMPGELEPLAESDADTRLERSFDSGAGGHSHEQGYAFSSPGLYDVTFVVWDSNGRYADADPFTVRFEVVPAPGAGAVLGLGGLLAARRRRP